MALLRGEHEDEGLLSLFQGGFVCLKVFADIFVEGRACDFAVSIGKNQHNQPSGMRDQIVEVRLQYFKIRRFAVILSSHEGGQIISDDGGVPGGPLLQGHVAHMDRFSKRPHPDGVAILQVTSHPAGQEPVELSLHSENALLHG
jgi:hypothetical protein